MDSESLIAMCNGILVWSFIELIFFAIPTKFDYLDEEGKPIKRNEVKMPKPNPEHLKMVGIYDTEDNSRLGSGGFGSKNPIRRQIPRQVTSLLFSLYANFNIALYYAYGKNDQSFRFTVIQLGCYLIVDTVTILMQGGFLNKRDLSMLLHHFLFGVEVFWFIFHPELTRWTESVVIPFVLAEISTVFLNSRWLVIHVFEKPKSFLVTALSYQFILSFVVARVFGYNYLLYRMFMQSNTLFQTLDSVSFNLTVFVIIGGSLINYFWLYLILKVQLQSSSKPKIEKTD